MTADPEDGASRHRLSAYLATLAGGMNAIGTVWIFVLMVLVNADVLGREAFSSPVRGVTEILSLSIVAIVFMQLSHTLWVGRITRSDALLARLIKNWPGLGHGLDALFHLTGAGLFAVIAWASLPYIQRAFSTGEYVGAFGDFTAPTWPVRLIIVIGSIVTGASFLALAWQRARLIIGSGR